MKKYIIISILFILFSFLGFVFLHPPEYKKTEKVLSKTNASTKNHELLNNKVKTIIELPEYIIKDIKSLGIDTKNFSEKKWKNFLLLLKKKELNNISFSKGSSKNNSILHLLSSMEKTDVKLIEELVNQGFDINQKNSKGITPVLLALRNTNLITVKKLIELGADIEVLTSLGFDALSYALKNKDIANKNELISYLIDEHGFSFDTKKHLWQASLEGNKSYLLPLIEKIPKEEIQNSFDITMRFGAIDDEILTKYQKNGLELDKIDPAKLIFCLTGNSNLTNTKVQELINNNVIDINKTFENINGMSPLMCAVMLGNYQKVELYLQNGANISCKDNKDNNVYDYLGKIIKNKRYNKDKIYKILTRYENNS
jgi:ankyrin repeat protein